jgi:hypothetical protein
MPVEASVEVNASVASHFSKVPSSLTEDFTQKEIWLLTGAMVKAGTAGDRD